MRIFLWIGAAAVLFGERAQAGERVGRMYELTGKAEGKPLFVQKIRREENPGGETVSDSTIVDDAGQLVMTEHAVMRGARMISQSMDQLQIGESYELEVHGDEALFKTFRLKDGKRELVSQKTQSVGPDFVTGPATERFLRDRWAAPGGAKETAADFGVFELEKTVGFTFEPRGLAENGQLAKVRLRPASFWVRLLLEPIDMECDAKTYALQKYRGRTPVRRRVRGSWKPFDALIVYTNE